MSVTVLSSPALPRHMQAERVDPNEGSRAGIPTGASVISRAVPIVVQYEQPNGGFEQMTQHVTMPTPDPPPAPIPQPIMSIQQPDSADALVAPDYQPVENRGDMVPVVRPATVVASATLATASVEPTRVNQHAPVTPQPQFPQPQRKVRVRMSNRSMGKLTVSVRAVSVSETCVILAYPKDADNIIEPPICGTENPIRVDFGSEAYKCVFGGWTADLEGMFLVILLRAEDENKG